MGSQSRLVLTDLADVIREQSQDVAPDHTRPKQRHDRPHGILSVHIIALDEVDDPEWVLDERSKSLLWMGNDMLSNGEEVFLGCGQFEVRLEVEREVLRE